MKGEWIVGLCSRRCGAFRLDLAPSPPSPPRLVERAPVIDWSGDLSGDGVYRIPSAFYVPRLFGCEVGAGLMTCCPLHADDTPSLHLSNEDARWYCHGACGRGGGLIAFYCALRGIPEPSRNDRHAIKKLLYDIADELRGTAR